MNDLFLIPPGARPLFHTKKWLENLAFNAGRTENAYDKELALQVLTQWVAIQAFELSWQRGGHQQTHQEFAEFSELSLIMPAEQIKEWEGRRGYEHAIKEHCYSQQQTQIEYEKFINSSTPSEAYTLKNDTIRNVWTAWFQASKKEVLSSVLDESLFFWTQHLMRLTSWLRVDWPERSVWNGPDSDSKQKLLLMSQLTHPVLDKFWKAHKEQGVVALLSQVLNRNEQTVENWLHQKTPWATRETVPRSWEEYWSAFFGTALSSVKELVKGVNLKENWSQLVTTPDSLRVVVPEELKQLGGEFKCLVWGGDTEYRKALVHSLLSDSGAQYRTLKPNHQAPLPLKLGLLGDGAYLIDESIWKTTPLDLEVVESSLAAVGGIQAWECATLDSVPTTSFDVVWKVADWPLEERLERVKAHWKSPTDAWRVAQHITSPQALNQVSDYCHKKSVFDWPTAQKFFLQNDEVAREVKKEASMLTRVSPSNVEFVGDGSTRQWLEDLINILNHPERAERFQVNTTSGVLLAGPPGTGKTHFVKSLSRQTQVPIYAASSSEMAQDVENVRRVFAQARKMAPCILFIDEVDILCGNPLEKFGINNKTQELVNAFLSEMDGIKARDGLWVMGATHRPVEVLDKAALRAGRFSEQIHLSLPDPSTREKMWAAHLKGKPTADLDFQALAFCSAGFSGAEIQRTVEMAALVAARKDSPHLDQMLLSAACDDLQWGVAVDHHQKAEEMRRTAVHEAGHALMYLIHGKDILRVTVRPRKRFLGAVQPVPKDNHYSLETLTVEMKICLGGIAAEEVVFGEYENGGSEDLKAISGLMNAATWGWGLSSILGPIRIDPEHASQTLKSEVEKHHIQWQAKLFEETKLTLLDRKDNLEALADFLEKKRDVSHEELKEWWNTRT